MVHYGDPSRPRPLTVLVGEAISLYVSAFRPMFGIALVGGTLAGLLGWAARDAQSNWMLVFWLFVTPLPLLVVAAPLTVLTWRLSAYSGDADSGDLALTSRFAARLVGGAIMLWVLFVGLTVAVLWVGMVLGAAIGTRWALFAPVVVAEDLSLTQAFQRSINLVRGRYWRTLGILSVMGLSLVATRYLGDVLVSSLGSPLLGALAGGVAQGLVLPIIVCFVYLLYLDYRRLEPTGPAPNSSL